MKRIRFALVLVIVLYSLLALSERVALAVQPIPPTITVPNPAQKPVFPLPPAYTAIVGLGFPFLGKALAKFLPKKAIPWVNLGLGIGMPILFGNTLGIDLTASLAGHGTAALLYDAGHTAFK